MGDYTRLQLKAMLKSSTPPQVIAVLKDAAALRQTPASELPAHPFFKSEWWANALHGRGGLAYYPSATGVMSLSSGDDGRMELSVHSSFKNGDPELDKLCSWLGPYLDHAPGDVVGEVDVDGYFGRKTSTLIAKPARIELVAAPDDDGSSTGGGFW